MERTRVLVVEDSTTVRRRIVEVIEADPQLEVVGEAADGRTAVEQCQRLRPDVVTLDMILPGISGLDATEAIMAWCPTPILIVSSSTNRGELFQTYEALDAGAVDVLEKPSGREPEGEWEERFVRAVKLVARIPVITHPRARLARAAGHAVPAPPAAPPSAFPARPPASPAPPAAEPALTWAAPLGASPPGQGRELALVAIGASTGGPSAILCVLRGLPRTFDVPVIVVLHIAAPFAASFAEWLESQCGLPVSIPSDGTPVPGRGQRLVLLAPPDRHLAVEGGRLRLLDTEPLHFCRPAVDVLFASVAAEYGPAAAGVLLTGMGRDGAQGLGAMRASGARTIAQDEATCVVYGMPREAVRLGAAELVLPLDAIGPRVGALAARQRPRRTP